MPPAASRGARRAPLIAALGAAASVLTIYAGAGPAPLLSALHGTSVSAIVVFVALTACGVWTLRTSSSSAWRWATGIGLVLATAQLLGLAFRDVGGLRDPRNLAWVIVHWSGTAWMAVGSLAALIGFLDVYGGRSVASGEPANIGTFARFVDSLQDPRRSRRRAGWLALMGILVVSRIPYLAVYWPGIVFFDTFRSYSYARGLGPWQTYEPVGASLLFAAFQWLGTNLGQGDTGTVAIGSVTLILASSAAYALMFVRMAVWGVPRALWWGAFAFIVLLPVFGYFSLFTVKDVPFSIAMVVFIVCIGELAFSTEGAQKWWPWVGMTMAGAAALVTRNNGVHVMALTIPLLLLVLRHLWKRLLAVLAALALVFALYVGPLYSVLKVEPGPQEEAYSVPIQQLGRIAKTRSATLSPADRAFMTRTFAGMSPEELGKHYVPGLSDPMKLQARKAWKDHTTGEFLVGWLRLAAEYPVTAITATLANTAGYWDPEGPSYDGITRGSSNDVRGIHMNIPSGPPTTGVAGRLERLMPSRSYSAGTQDDGYRAIPVLGLAMSPGPICWVWLVSGVLVIRRRSRTALAVFVPVGVLLLSFLAGPVSGGQRYSLTLFMALPVALAAVALSSRSAIPDEGKGSPADPGRASSPTVAQNPDVEESG